MTASPSRVEDQLVQVADRLHTEFAGVPDSRLRELVDEAYAPYRTAKVTNFVPVLVHRSVREQLRRLATTGS